MRSLFDTPVIEAPPKKSRKAKPVAPPVEEAPAIQPSRMYRTHPSADEVVVEYDESTGELICMGIGSENDRGQGPIDIVHDCYDTPEHAEADSRIVAARHMLLKACRSALALTHLARVDPECRNDLLATRKQLLEAIHAAVPPKKGK